MDDHNSGTTPVGCCNRKWTDFRHKRILFLALRLSGAHEVAKRKKKKTHEPNSSAHNNFCLPRPFLLSPKIWAPVAGYRYDSYRGAGMAQWWEHSSPNKVEWVRFPDSASYVGCVCCWFFNLLREVFSGYSGFSLPLKTNISKFQFDLEYCQALLCNDPCSLCRNGTTRLRDKLQEKFPSATAPLVYGNAQTTQTNSIFFTGIQFLPC